jgi:hypothetical protein
MKWPVRVTLPVGIFALSLLAGLVVVSNLHIGVARTIIVLAFLSIAPGGAILNLLLPDLADWPTTLLLTVGASFALDVASTQAALWAHAWDPTAMIGALAVLAAALSGLSLVRLQSTPGTLSVPAIALPDFWRRAGHLVLVAPPVFVLLVGLAVEFVRGHPRQVMTGAAGAIAACLATAAVVYVVLAGSPSDSPVRRRQGIVASCVLVALVVLVVSARFALIR